MRRELVSQQFLDPFLKETAFRLLGGQGQGPFVCFAGLGRPSKSAAQVGAGRVSEVVIGQLAIRKDIVDQVQSRRGAPDEAAAITRRVRQEFPRMDGEGRRVPEVSGG
jgi:hypothetical protein